MSETSGDRLFKIRLACGDGVRKAQSLDAFAERVRRETGAVYDPSTISLLERMKQGWRLDDVRAFAAVDPLNRGEVWLSALNDVAGIETFDPRKDRKLTMQEIARAREQAARERAQSTESAKPAVKKRRGGAA